MYAEGTEHPIASHYGLDHQERVFNYRLSRGRRVVENAFGILANKWRCFHRPIPLEIDTAKNVIIAACTLHNMLRQKQPGHSLVADNEDAQHRVVAGTWRDGQDLEPLQVERGNKCNKAAAKQRDLLKAYFNSPAGSVPWQDDYVLTC